MERYDSEDYNAYGYNPAAEICGFYSDEEEDEGVFVPASEMLPLSSSKTGTSKKVELPTENLSSKALKRSRTANEDFTQMDTDHFKILQTGTNSKIYTISQNTSFHSPATLSSVPAAPIRPPRPSDAKIHLLWARERLKRITPAKLIPGFQAPDYSFSKNPESVLDDEIEIEEFLRFMKQKPRESFDSSRRIWVHRQKRLDFNRRMQPQYHTIDE